MKFTPYWSHEPANEVWRREVNVVLPGPGSTIKADTWPTTVPLRNSWGYNRPVLPPKLDFHPAAKLENEAMVEKRYVTESSDPEDFAPSVSEFGGLSIRNAPTAVPTKTMPIPMPLRGHGGHGPVVFHPPIPDDSFQPVPMLPRDLNLVAREEVTLLPAAGIYSIPERETVNESPSKDENNQVMTTLHATRRPLYTLPVQTPTPDIWRREIDQEPRPIPEDNAANLLPSADSRIIITHEPADAIWRRSDELSKEKRSAQPVPPPEFFEDDHHLILHGPAIEARSPIKIDLNGGKPKIPVTPAIQLMPDSEVYRRDNEPSKRSPVKIDLNGGKPKVPVTPAIQLMPDSEVYRRNVDSTLLDDLFDAEHRGFLDRRADPADTAYDEALSAMRAALEAFIALCTNPTVLAHLETDSVEKCQAKVRKALKHINTPSPSSTPPSTPSTPSPVPSPSTLPLVPRRTTDEENAQRKKERENEVALRAWQKYQDTCGGLLAFACEPKCRESDPWPCIPQPAVAMPTAGEVYR